MSLKLKFKGNKTIVETDYPAASSSHKHILDDCGEVVGAMKTYGIKELEVPRHQADGYGIREEFNRELKKKGFKENYFHRWKHW